MVSNTKSRSWHGTSVQCVQPRPITVKLKSFCTSEATLTSGSTSDNVSIYSYHTPHKRGNSSPTLSPMSHKRYRTFTEKGTHSSIVAPDMSEIHFDDLNLTSVEYRSCMMSQFSISNFRLVDSEMEALHTLQNATLKYVITKRFNDDNNSYPSLCHFVSSSCYSNVNNEKADIHFMNVLSLKADSQDTITLILHDIYNTFICKQMLKWIVVVGDAKTYEVLYKVKREYGLTWLIVFPGDWHILYNYQKVIMKIYWDAGLMQLAQAAGYKAESLTSLSKASNFRRTHDFFLQVYEAFTSAFSDDMFSSFPQDLMKKLNDEFKPLVNAISNTDVVFAMQNILHHDVSNSKLTEKLCSHIKECAKASKTCLFWSRFLESDILAYIGLYVSIRNGDWHLRNASIKRMTAIFFAFDRPMSSIYTFSRFVNIAT